MFKNQTQFIQTSIDSESWRIYIYIYLYIRRYVQDPNRIWDVYLDQNLIQLMFCILYFHFLVFYKKRDNSCQDSFVFITGCVSEVKEGAPANMIQGLDNGLLKLPKLHNFLFPHFFLHLLPLSYHVTLAGKIHLSDFCKWAEQMD